MLTTKKIGQIFSQSFSLAISYHRPNTSEIMFCWILRRKIRLYFNINVIVDSENEQESKILIVGLGSLSVVKIIVFSAYINAGDWLDEECSIEIL